MLIKVFREVNWRTSLLILIVVCTSTTVTYGELCVFNSTSPTCQKLLQIRQSLDERVDPCNDFFGYACNNWRQHIATPYYDSTMKLLEYQLNYNLISVMDGLENVSLPLRILNETYIYYKSCLNAEGTNPLVEVLEIIKPGEDLEWPLLQKLKAFRRGDSNFFVDDWPADRFDLFALIGLLKTYGLNDIMFRINVMKNSSGTVLVDFSPQPFFQDQFSDNAQGFAVLLYELGFSTEIASYYSLRLQTYLQYWNHDLARQQNNRTYIITYGEMKIKFPYLAKMLENIPIHRCADKCMIRINSLEYFDYMMKKSWSPVEKRNLCDYIMLRLMYHLYEFRHTRSRKMDCIFEVQRKLELPVNLLYYAYVYRPDELHTNADIEGLFRKTRDYMVQALTKFPDMAEIKMQFCNTSLNIGNLPRNMSALYFDKLYGDLPDLSANDFYGNKLKLAEHLARLSLVVDNNATYFQYYGNWALYIQYTIYLDTPKLLLLPFGNLQQPSYHYTFDPIFKWSSLAYFLARGLYGSLPNNYYNFQLTFFVDVLYQAYANEQKNRLQPEFTNISWKKLFFLNLAQNYCTTDTAVQMSVFSSFLRTFPYEIASFVDAFQCNHTYT